MEDATETKIDSNTPSNTPSTTPSNPPNPNPPKLTKKEKCKILWVKSNSIAVDFKNHGIEVPKQPYFNPKSGEFVNIKYSSDIGNADFVYEIW